MAINYKVCPKCSSKNVVIIIYGMPTHETFLKAEAGEVKLGGCCITGDDPEYYCKDCGHEWDRQQAIDHAYKQINGIKASVGGYFGGYYEVEIDLRSRNLTWSHSLAGDEGSFQKTIRQSTASKLLEELKFIGVLDWKSKYVDPYILDGTQLSLDVFTSGRTIKKHGSNQFPEEWDLFCRLIKRISGKPFK